MLKKVFAFVIFTLPVCVFAQPIMAVGDTISICGPGVGAVGVRVEGGIGPFTYQWSVGPTEQIITPYVANSSDFFVTVTDADGHKAIAVARINVNPIPGAVFVQPAPVWCQGLSVRLSLRMEGAYPLSFRYTLNGKEQAPVSGVMNNLFNFPINKGGLYQITEVKDRNGCIGNTASSIFVPESDLEMRGAVEDIRCDGAFGGNVTIYVIGGAPPYDYAWTGPQPGGNTPELAGVIAGEYYVTVTDSRGCELTNQFSVDQPPPLIAAIAASQPVNCLTGGSIDLSVSGGRPPYRYLWNNNVTVQDPQNLTAGSYTVTITDRSGCTASITTEVTMNTVKPTAAAMVNNILTCDNKSVRIDGSGSDAGLGFIYRWEAEPGFIIDGINTLYPTVNQPGQYKLVVINQNNGCTATVTAKVLAEKNYPVSNPGRPQTITCVIPNATLVAEGNLSNDFIYHWTAPPTGNILGGVTTLTPIVRGAGPYTLTVTNRTNGCSSTASVTVVGDFQSPTAVIEPPQTLSCTVASITLDGSASQPKDSIAYYWQTSGGSFLSSPASASVLIGSQGAYTLVVTNLKNGCTATHTAEVQRSNANASLVVTSEGDLTCTRTSVRLDGSKSVLSPDLLYEWRTDIGTFISGRHTLTPVVNAPGRYTLVVTNPATNCVLSHSVNVKRDVLPPVVDAGSPRTINCVHREVLLGNANVLYEANWEFYWTHAGEGNILSGTREATAVVNRPGVYQLQVVNPTNACSALATVRVQLDTITPSVAIYDPPILNCLNNAVRLQGETAGPAQNYRYLWTSEVNNGILAGERSLNPLVRATGTYTLEVTDPSNGCAASASTVVSGQSNELQLELRSTGTITCKEKKVRLLVTSSGGLPLRYQWNTLDGNIINGADSASIEVDQPGTYTVSGIYTLNGCTATASILVLADRSVPQITISPDMTIDCKQTPLTLTGASQTGGSVTYRWSSVDSGNILGDLTNPSVQVNAAGNYQLVVANVDNGCTASANVLVNADAATPFVVLDTVAFITCSKKQVIIDATQSSSGPDFTYTWQGPGIVTGNGTLLLAVNETGTYTLNIVSKNGCSVTASVSVSKDVAIPEPHAGGPDLPLNCIYPQRTLQPPNAAAHTYQWSGPGLLSGALTATPIVEKKGDYMVTVTSIRTGCTALDTVTVTEDFERPQADAGPTFQLTCFQTTYTIPASATHGSDITYEWTTIGGNIVSPTHLLNPVVDGAGHYFLKVTNNRSGCAALASVQIYQAANMPIASAGNQSAITCTQPTVTLDGSGSSRGAVFKYEWKSQPGGHLVSGINSVRPVVDKPGVYILTVTDTVNWCAASSSVEITEDKFTPSIDAGHPLNLTCWRDTLRLTALNATNGYFTYRWQTPSGIIVRGDTTLQPIIAKEGMYILSATNPQNGCVATDTVQVVGDQLPPNAAFKVDHSLTCTDKTALLSADLGPGQFEEHYFFWNTPDGRLISANNGFSVRADRPGTYHLIVTNIKNGCKDTSSVLLPIDTITPVISAGPDLLINCKTTSVELHGSVQKPDSDYFYQWLTFDGNLVLGGNGLRAVADAQGTYALVVKNTKNGCIGMDKMIVNADFRPPAVSVTPPDGLQCNREEVTLDGSTSIQSAGIMYRWITSGGQFTGATDSVKTKANAPGIYILTAFNQNNGCIGSDTVQVSSNFILPIVEAGSPFFLTCDLPAARLQAYASGGPVYSFSWATTGGQFVSDQNTLSPLVDKPGYYHLQVLNNSTGCTNADSVLIIEETLKPDSVSYAIDSLTCKKDKGTLSFLKVQGGVPPYTYSIDGGQNFSMQMKFAELTPATYPAVVQDINGCEYAFSVVIPDAEQPLVTIREDLLKGRAGDTIYVNATMSAGYPQNKIDTIIWKSSSPAALGNLSSGDRLHPFIIPQRSTALSVQLVSTDGCTSTDVVRIEVDNKMNIYVANAFMPDAKNRQNARLLVSADDDRIARIRAFRIFDRWGSLVFESHDFQPNDPTAGWDGTINGAIAPPDVFSWYVEVELKDQQVRLFEGDTAVIR